MTAVDWPTDGASLLPLAAMPVPYDLVIGRCSVEHVVEQTRSLPAVAELLGFSAQGALARSARGLAEASRNGGSKSL